MIIIYTHAQQQCLSCYGPFSLKKIANIFFLNYTIVNNLFVPLLRAFFHLRRRLNGIAIQQRSARFDQQSELTQCGMSTPNDHTPIGEADARIQLGRDAFRPNAS